MPHYCRLVLLILLASLVVACGQLRASKTKLERFEDTFRAYSQYLRWGDFANMASFMTPAHASQSLAMVDHYQAVRITGVRPISWDMDEKAGQVSGKVRIDYYLTNQGVVKSMTHQQTWLWMEEAKRWLIDNGLPALK